MNDYEWFESRSGDQPRVGKFGKDGDWYAEIVHNGARITGNGKTMRDAIGDCRKRVSQDRFGG